ncbi:MAG: polysulfide reductase NrfD [SAR324 cluster bacterium]|nr:polysulfide reductase NrfD [SAR324 cluster bacterium]
MESIAAWDIRVTIDLFLGGVGVGAFLLSVLASFYDREKHWLTVRAGAVLAPVTVGVGLLVLVTKLGRPEKFITTLWNVNPLSIMSIGVFIQTGFMLFACLYAAMILFQPDKIDWKLRLAQILGSFFAAGTGLYHGLFLSSLGRVLWTEMTPGMFLASSLATGTAAIMLIRTIQAPVKPEGTRDFSYRITLLVVLAFQLVSVILWQFYTGRLELEQELSYRNFMENHETLWTTVVLIGGIIIPGLAALYSMLKQEVKMGKGLTIIACVLVLTGGFVMKHLMVIGGQVVVPIIELL